MQEWLKGLDRSFTRRYLRVTPGNPMHEVGIMSSAMDAVLEQARARGASRVHRIVLRIGALSGVEPDALRFAFDVVTRETMASEATLEVEPVPARAYCSTCRSEFDAEGSVILACPGCGNFSGDIRRGRELELAQIEMS